MKKRQLISLSILLIISASLGYASLTSGHNWAYSDFASYIMQAKSILAWDMDGFVAQNSITILESDLPVGPIAYPWGYSLLLAPVVALTGLSTLSMKLLNTLLFLAFLLVLYFLARKRLQHFDSLALVALFAVNSIFIKSQDSILSDIAFLFLSTLAVFLIDYWDSDVLPPKQKYLHQMMIGLAIFAAFITRTNGLLLLPSLMAYEIFFAVKRRTIKASLSRWLLPLITFLLLWGIFSIIFPDGQASHLEHYQNFEISQLWKFSAAYIRMAGEFFGENYIAPFFYVIFGVFFIVGFFSKFKENLLFSLYLFSTLLLYVSWPYLQGVRFLFPILPFFAYISLQGMWTFSQQLPEASSRWLTFFYRGLLVTIIATMFIASFQYASQNLAQDRAIHGPFDDVAIELFEYVKNQTPEDSRIIFFKPRIMTLMTGRDSILVLSCDNLAKADYVVINLKWEDMGQIAPEEITSCATPLGELYKNRRFVIYKIGD